MPGAFKFLGWLLISLGGLMLLLVIIAFFEDSEDSRAAMPGLLFFLAATGVPGLLLLKKGRTEARKRALFLLMTDAESFALDDAVRRSGAGQAQVEQLVMKIAVERRFDFVFDPAKKRFYRRSTIQEVHPIEPECPSCGAKLGPMRLDKGQTARCPYCNEPVRVAS